MGINLLFFKSSTTVGIKHKNSISISYLATKVVNLILFKEHSNQRLLLINTREQFFFGIISLLLKDNSLLLNLPLIYNLHRTSPVYFLFITSRDNNFQQQFNHSYNLFSDHLRLCSTNVLLQIFIFAADHGT